MPRRIMGWKGLGEHSIDLISPTAVMFDDLIGDSGHEFLLVLTSDSIADPPPAPQPRVHSNRRSARAPPCEPASKGRGPLQSVHWLFLVRANPDLSRSRSAPSQNQ